MLKPVCEPIEFFAENPQLKDFRNFVHIVWKTLRLPEPTRIQYDIAYHLQHGESKLVIEGFRGVAKTYITAAFVVWSLGWDPAKNILVVSASKDFADQVSTFILQIIKDVPGLEVLSCEGRERHSKVSFDVGPAPSSKDPSVSSVGITGQITGHRADIVLADDVESSNNSLTQSGRERIAAAIREFGMVVKPGGRVVMLGTPHSEQSIYNLMPERGYTIRLWPVQYPDPKQLAAYGGRLSPMLSADLESGRAQAGQPTDPARFGELEIAFRRAEAGRTGFALQYMLDTALSDADRYPLKLSDLVVMDCPDEVGPEKWVWSNDPRNELRDLIAVGLNGDRFFAPTLPEKLVWSSWEGGVMFIDPAGTGADETAYAIVKHLNGNLYCPECTGLAGGHSDTAMVTLAAAAARHKVNRIIVEANFGDGMFEKLLQPHVARTGWRCSIEGLKVSKQKELRILDVLEPVLSQHRLAVAPAVFRDDAHRSGTLSVEKAHQYLLAYQMTRITRERGCLAHDDRIDALAGAVAVWVEAMAKDVDESAAAARRRAWELHLDDFTRYGTGRPVAPRTWIHQEPATNRLR